jgi:LysR family glycine cleavage system transcriptional activator
MLTSMSRLPLHTLPAFRAVAQSCNLRAAAETLHLTHSAVSQQIKVLEEQLGFQLFERRGRRILLNASGRSLLSSVEAALAQLEAGVQAAATAAAGADQPLRLTVLPSFANRWLLPRLARWRERHPDIALEVDASPRLVDLQRDGFHAAVRIASGPGCRPRSCWSLRGSRWPHPPRPTGCMAAAWPRCWTSRSSAMRRCGRNGSPRPA